MKFFKVSQMLWKACVFRLAIQIFTPLIHVFTCIKSRFSSLFFLKYFFSHWLNWGSCCIYFWFRWRCFLHVAHSLGDVFALLLRYNFIHLGIKRNTFISDSIMFMKRMIFCHSDLFSYVFFDLMEFNLLFSCKIALHQVGIHNKVM